MVDQDTVAARTREANERLQIIGALALEFDEATRTLEQARADVQMGRLGVGGLEDYTRTQLQASRKFHDAMIAHRRILEAEAEIAAAPETSAETQDSGLRTEEAESLPTSAGAQGSDGETTAAGRSETPRTRRQSAR